jgi:hypothetical protein
LEVEFNASTPVLKLCSFAAWLPRHAALVKGITAFASPYAYDREDGTTAEQYSAVAHQLLQPALQLARLLPAEAAAAGGSASSAKSLEHPHQKQPGLQLQRFRSNLPGCAGMLTDLPAHSLTALDLEFQSKIGADGSALSALLARLSSLQQLRLSSMCSRISIPGSCLAGIASLPQLTELILDGTWQQYEQPLQQLLDQPLPLRLLQLELYQLPVLDMSQLNSLEELVVGYGLTPGTVLPAQLQRLQLFECPSVIDVTALQHLQEFTLNVRFEDHTQLMGLAQLPSLRHLALDYREAAETAATAPGWQHLPQLQELLVEYEDSFPSRQQMDVILAGVAACTQLTKLALQVGQKLGADAADGAESQDDEDEGDDNATMRVAACGSLAGLTRLRDLAFPSSSYLVHGDALALTALTALTRLDLSGTASVVDNVVASALACSLKHLCYLDLSYSNSGSMVCLAAVGHLSKLTVLDLKGVGGMTERGLMLLTRLSSLQNLAVTQNAEVTDDVLNRFWAALRQQRR